MSTASEMSAKIRAKKKKMKEEESGAVKLSGIPEDATDIDAIKQREIGEALSENVPKEHSDDPEDTITTPDPAMSEVSPDPKQINQPEDGEKETKKAKMRKSMAKAMAK